MVTYSQYYNCLFPRVQALKSIWDKAIACLIDKTNFQNWWEKSLNLDGKCEKKTKRLIYKKPFNSMKWGKKPKDRTKLLNLKEYDEKEL